MKNLYECASTKPRSFKTETFKPNIAFGLNQIGKDCSKTYLANLNLEHCEKYSYSYRIKAYCEYKDKSSANLKINLPLRMKPLKAKIVAQFDKSKEQVIERSANTDHEGLFAVSFTTTNPIASSKTYIYFKDKELNSTDRTEIYLVCD